MRFIRDRQISSQHSRAICPRRGTLQKVPAGNVVGMSPPTLPADRLLANTAILDATARGSTMPSTIRDDLQLKGGGLSARPNRRIVPDCGPAPDATSPGAERS